MLIESKAVSPFFKNGYLISFEPSTEAVLIDPGDEVDLLLEIVDRKKFKVTHILLTHAHIDHLFGVTKAKNTTGAMIYLHPDDLKLYANAKNHARAWGFEIEDPPKVDAYLADGQIIKIADYEIKVIHTPGHTQGSVCFILENNLFCGDTIFAGSVGRTDLPGGDFNKMIASINNKLLVLDEEIIVYSGHGPASTIGYEKLNNPFLGGRF